MVAVGPKKDILEPLSLSRQRMVLVTASPFFQEVTRA
jgi:hypothetical protein